MPTAERKKKRVRNWTPDDRAAHREFERSRREAFNEGLIELARQVPSLAGVRRLNKHMIVNESTSRLKAQRTLCLSVARELRALLIERDSLLAEINQWRGSSALPLQQARELSQPLEKFLRTDQETFGAFPNGFGDNGNGDETEEGHGTLSGEHPTFGMDDIEELAFQEYQVPHFSVGADADSAVETIQNVADTEPPTNTANDIFPPSQQTTFGHMESYDHSLAEPAISMTTSSIPQDVVTEFDLSVDPATVDWHPDVQTSHELGIGSRSFHANSTQHEPIYQPFDLYPEFAPGHIPIQPQKIIFPS